MNALLSRVVLLADPDGDIDPATGRGPEWGKASPVGLMVILLMSIALFLLMWSMVKHLKKVQAMKDQQDAPATVDAQGEPRPQEQLDGTAESTVNADPGTGPPGLVDKRSG